MLSSCLNPQYNLCSFAVLQHPPYLMVHVTVITYWYDNYGLAVLQQLQDLMPKKRSPLGGSIRALNKLNIIDDQTNITPAKREEASVKIIAKITILFSLQPHFSR